MWQPSDSFTIPLGEWVNVAVRQWLVPNFRGFFQALEVVQGKPSVNERFRQGGLEPESFVQCRDSLFITGKKSQGFAARQVAARVAGLQCQ